VEDIRSTEMAASDLSPLESVGDRSNRAFEQLAGPLRRELKVHCYRMLGSVHEADDAVQEDYLRAWRSFKSFDGRGPFRAWSHRIATNVCLDVLASRKQARRFLPDERAPATAEMPNGKPATDLAWLEPYPDAELEGVADEASNPEARYTTRQSVQLAFVAVVQQSPPRQRAGYCGAMSSGGLLPRLLRCLVDRSRRSIAPCSGCERPSLDAIPQARHRPSLPKTPLSRSFSTVI
jgi:RNA polymerase sigma-70 factor (ECF subfamily)